MSIEETLFNATVKNRFPIAHEGITAVSAASTWTARQARQFDADGNPKVIPEEDRVTGAFIPRPDRTIGTLRIMSLFGILGLDHFYLRSPVTGLIKLFTFGGFFIWWIWDAAQAFTEGDRVMEYGMTLPFDLGTGIGQGMITNKDTNYKQNANYSMFAIGALLSFVGVDSMFAGKWAQFIRKIVDFVIFASLLGSLFTGGHGIISLVFHTIFLALFGVFVWGPWWGTVSNTIFNPQRMFTKGIKFSDEIKQMLNYFNVWTKSIGKMSYEHTQQEFGYGEMPPGELARLFRVKYSADKETGDDEVETDEAEEGGTGSDSKPIWPMALMLGNAITGWIISIVAKFSIQARIIVEGLMARTKEEEVGAVAGVFAAIAEEKIGSKLKGSPLGAMMGSGGPLGGLTGGLTGALGSGSGRSGGPGGAGGLAGALGAVTGGKGGLAGALGAATGGKGGLAGALGAVTGGKGGLAGALGAISKPALEQAMGSHTGPAASVLGALAGGQNLTSAVTGVAQGALEQSAKGAFGRAREAAALGSQLKKGGLLGTLGTLAAGAATQQFQQQQSQQAAAAQKGGARPEPLSTEAKIFGATTIALIGGGVIKYMVDSLGQE